MASLFLKLLFLFTLNFLTSTSISHKPILPKAAILPLTKDPSTNQYLTKFSIGNNKLANLVLDLNSPFTWVTCNQNSRKPIKACSLHCSMAKSSSSTNKPGYNSNSKRSCTLETENTITRMSSIGELNEDEIGLKFDSGSIVNSDEFIFSCGSNSLLKGLANGANGMLGLGNSRISLPSQIWSKFGFFDRKFSFCLPKSSSKGAIFLGGNPHESQILNSMVYTPLISNKNGYYINVNSIKISNAKLSFNQTVAKLSTTVPYTSMESKMFRLFVDAYVVASKSMNLSLVPSVGPFEVCFRLEFESTGPVVDFLLQSEMVKWRVVNVMVPVGGGRACLGVVDGGLGVEDRIVIGGYQLEDYFVEVNLGNSMVGFSNSLSTGGHKCPDIVQGTDGSVLE